MTVQFGRLGVQVVIRRYHAVLAASLLLLTIVVIPSSLDSSIRFDHVAPRIQPDLKGPWVALTFDDGPHAGKTEALLDVLRKARVPATFFVVGKMADRYPMVLQEIARQGHELANHTYTHPDLSRLPAREILRELDETRDVVKRLTGQDAVFYRPPGGDFSRRMVKAAADAGYTMILWTVLVPDTSGATPVAMRRRILRQVEDGAIVLMHSGIQNTIDMLPRVIAELKARGFNFCTVSELLGKAPHTPVKPAPQPPLQTASHKKY